MGKRTRLRSVKRRRSAAMVIVGSLAVTMCGAVVGALAVLVAPSYASTSPSSCSRGCVLAGCLPSESETGPPPPSPPSPPVGGIAGVPQTPPNNKVGIFVLPGLDPTLTTQDERLDQLLTSEGYDVTLVDQSPLAEAPSLPGHATANVAGFLSMAGDGALIVNTHGDPEGDVLLQFFGNEAEAKAVVARYSAGWMKAIIFRGDPAVVLEPAGIRATFGRKPSGLVIASFCYSISGARAWNATDYFGYGYKTNNPQSDTDQMLLINRLTGAAGQQLRTAASAYEAGGFDPYEYYNGNRRATSYLLLAHRNGAPTTVLDPTVTSVTPPDHSHLDPGRTTAVVVFDAKMSKTRPGSLVYLSGTCDATVAKASWTSVTTLQFTVQVPRAAPPNCTVDGRLSATGTVAGGGWRARLDGDTNPPGSDGQAPNGDDYTWSYTSGVPVSATSTSVPTFDTYTVDYSGTYHSVQYQEFDNGPKNPIAWDLSWAATASFTTQGEGPSHWHYTTVTGSITETVNEPNPSAKACHIDIGETPGFEATSADSAEFVPDAGPHELSVHANAPFFTAGLLTVTGGPQTYPCSLSGGTFISPTFTGQSEIKWYRATTPTFVANHATLPETMDFPFSDGGTNLTSSISVSAG